MAACGVMIGIEIAMPEHHVRRVSGHEQDPDVGFDCHDALRLPAALEDARVLDDRLRARVSGDLVERRIHLQDGSLDIGCFCAETIASDNVSRSSRTLMGLVR